MTFLNHRNGTNEVLGHHILGEVELMVDEKNQVEKAKVKLMSIINELELEDDNKYSSQGKVIVEIKKIVKSIFIKIQQRIV